MTDKCMMVFDSCKSIKGYNRGIIIDFHRFKYFYVPNTLIDFLNENDRMNLIQIKKNYIENKEIIEEYLDFSESNEIITFTDYSLTNNFPKMKEEFYYPGSISNIILDFNLLMYDFGNFLVEAVNFGARFLQIRFFNKVSCDFLNDILSRVCDKGLYSIELIINYDDLFENKNLNLITKFNLIQNIFCYNSPKNGLEEIYSKQIIHSKQSKINLHQCGYVSKNSFSFTTDHFFESKKYNSCLNKKISVDEFGVIKKCPSSIEVLGYVNNFDLNIITNLNEFSKYDLINKEKIEVCKDCEHIHICTDCRINVSDPKNIFSKPKFCTYNPYISKWDGEEGYKTLAECGVISNENGFSIDHDKIAEINKVLWGE